MHEELGIASLLRPILVLSFKSGASNNALAESKSLAVKIGALKLEASIVSLVLPERELFFKTANIQWLFKSVLANLPTYYMSLFCVPKDEGFFMGR